MTKSIAAFVMIVLFAISSLSFADSSHSVDEYSSGAGVCSGTGDVKDHIWNIAIGDIDVVWGGSGWSDEVVMDGMDFFFVHDIDGDGNEDFVITDGTMPWQERAGPRTGSIYFNNGDGTFTLAAGDRPESEHARVALFEDFDGDKRTDIFIIDHGWDTNPYPGFPNQLLLNKESGFVDVSASHLPDTNAEFSHGGAAGDVDKDGDLDIFVTNVNVDDPYLLINDGTGHFTRDTSRLPAEFFTDETFPPVSAKLVDLDQDGFVDLGTGNWFGHPNVVYWGNAEGVFSSDSMTALPNPFFYENSFDVPSFHVRDFNEDGKPDLLLGYYGYSLEDGAQILINQGDRTFADETLKRLGNSAYTGPDRWPATFRFFDFNDDGTIDIVPSNYSPDNAVNLAWLNDGTGHYAPVTHDMYNKPDASYRFGAHYTIDAEGFSAIEWYYVDGILRMNEGVVTSNPVLTHSGTGSDGRDFITGSRCDDTIKAGAADDRIDGGAGSDVLTGGPGNDQMNDGQGDETYILNAADLAGYDLVWDYGGFDTLVFANFGLDQVASVAQHAGGHLSIDFTDGGNIVVIGHFANTGQAVEKLIAGACHYEISRDANFTSGPIESVLSDCEMFSDLTGIIVDAGDGITPVHPVSISLIDPLTGDLLDISVVNHPDGTYAFRDLPTDDYKLLFNAHGDANNYVDELYDGAFCDNGSCDMANQGTALSLNGGGNVLNVDLIRQVALSGRVTNTSNEPMKNVALELLDEIGALIGEPTFTNDNGEWVRGVAGSGSFYVRTRPDTTRDHHPEVWKDTFCDECDVTDDGDPIVVGALDIPDIDFELEPIVYPDYHCRAKDLIHFDSFETLPAREIVFTSDASGIITEAGQQLDFTVELLDEQGAVTDPSSLEWCLTDTRNLELAAAGGTATVSASGMGTSSVQLVVRDAASGEEARATVIFTELRDDAG